MNQESPRILALLACLAVASCEAVPVDPGLIEGPADGLAHHRPDHTGGPGGGGEEPPPEGFELTMSGGITTGPVATMMLKETNRRLDLAIPSAQLVFTSTHAAAVDEISNPSNAAICEFRPDTMPPATKQAFAAALQAFRSDGRLVVNKFENKGNVLFNHTEDGGLWTSWGFNIQHDDNVQQAADVTYDGIDKQDATATRHFRYGGAGLHGGFIRVLNPGSGDGDMVCLVQDEMLAVVAPGTP